MGRSAKSSYSSDPENIFQGLHLKKCVAHAKIHCECFNALPVSGWQVPCWWQLHGTQGDRGPLPGCCRVNPGEHCSQNWPAKPGGQEQDSTHGAPGLARPEEMRAEVRVTLASCDVSGVEGWDQRGTVLTKVSGKLIITTPEVSWSVWGYLLFPGNVCVCVLGRAVPILLSSRSLAFVADLSPHSAINATLNAHLHTREHTCARTCTLITEGTFDLANEWITAAEKDEKRSRQEAWWRCVRCAVPVGFSRSVCPLMNSDGGRPSWTESFSPCAF